MKVKLLKKIRERFKWEFAASENPIAKIQLKVFDKVAIAFKFMPLKNRVNYQFYTWNISDVTPAEEMASFVLGSWSLVKKHRHNIYIRKNRTFIKQNWPNE